jgi:hypothetical protein
MVLMASTRRSTVVGKILTFVCRTGVSFHVPPNRDIAGHTNSVASALTSRAGRIADDSWPKKLLST